MSSGNELDPEKETTWSEYDAEEDPSPPSQSSMLLIEQYHAQENGSFTESNYDDGEHWIDVGVFDDPKPLNNALIDEIEKINVCWLNKII